jgi:DNA adenine methylase
MLQQSLFVEGVPTSTTQAVVNVASVPQRSPFRYPGGKTWLVPIARQWLKAKGGPGVELIEPFAGGAIISLTAVFEDLVDNATLVELDPGVAAVWRTLFGPRGQQLAQQILDFDLTEETVDRALSAIPKSQVALAFQTILKNRVNHGGILAPGSGRIKFGENGKGMRSRWYPQTLYTRMTRIAHLRKRFRTIHGDGIEVMVRQRANKNTLFFIDPPYTAAGKQAGRRLYLHNELDHRRLFQVASALAGDFIMTYDWADGVIDLAVENNLDYEPVSMKSTHHAEMQELVIGRDLSWLRRDSTDSDCSLREMREYPVHVSQHSRT